MKQPNNQGEKILELSNNAENLYKKATPSERRELLNYSLWNSALKDKKPLLAYKKTL